jgi:Mn2+/Fe2+ NRAMP family transporter
MFAFAGPAYLVSVGHGPGQLGPDLEGGARFGYQ